MKLRSFSWIALSATLLSGATVACSATTDTEESEDELRQASTCDEACVITLFKEFSKVPRGSFDEEKARAWIRKQVKNSASAWRSIEKLEVLEAGVMDGPNNVVNMVVRVPATGKYRDAEYANLKPIALQAHLDMVFAAKDAQPGESLNPFFQNGVDVVEDDAVDADGARILDGEGKPIRILHSRDFKTTLGADNGQGVAQMVRYIRNPNLPHPKLELVFTAAEEVGLVGAMDYDKTKLPLAAAALISLDGSSTLADDPLDKQLLSPLSILIGANGGVMSVTDAKLPALVLASGTTTVKISLSGLKGGHSGFDIGLKRMSAVRALVELLEKAQELDSSMQLVDVSIGDYNGKRGQNRIANAFTATIAVSSASLEEVAAAVNTRFKSYARPFTDENKNDLKLEVTAGEAGAGALTPSMTTKFIASVKALPQGIQEKDDRFPNAAASSSNVGFLGLGSMAGEKSVTFGYLPRSYFLDKAVKLDNKTFDTIESLAKAGGVHFEGSSFAHRAGFQINPWFVSDTSDVVKLTRATKDERGKAVIAGTIVLAGGTEPGEFMRMFPQLKERVIGLGPNIIDAHTNKELMGVESFKHSTTVLQEIIENWAEDRNFLK